MNYLDYIIAGLILIGFVLGYKDGLVRKIIGLAGIILGIFLAVKLSARFGKFVAPALDNEAGLSEVISGVLIFMLCVLAASIIKRLVHPHDKLNKFLNQLLGGITGTVQITFFISGFLLFLSIFSFPKTEDTKNSLLYNSVYSIMPETIDFMIGGKNFLKNGIMKKIGAPEEEQNKVKPVVTEKKPAANENSVRQNTAAGKETKPAAKTLVKKKVNQKGTLQAKNKSEQTRKNKDS